MSFLGTFDIDYRLMVSVPQQVPIPSDTSRTYLHRRVDHGSPEFRRLATALNMFLKRSQNRTKCSTTD